MNTTETALNILIEKLTAIEKEVKKTPDSNQDFDVLMDELNSINTNMVGANTQNKKDFEQIKLLLKTDKKPPKRPLVWSVSNAITAAAVIVLCYFQFLATNTANYNSEILSADKEDLILTDLTYMYLSNKKDVFTTDEFNTQKQRFLKQGKTHVVRQYKLLKMQEADKKANLISTSITKVNSKQK